MTELRGYQSRALDEVERAHESARRVCLVMPTGAGKSVVSREWCRRQVASGRRGLMVAHRIELLTQFSSHLSAVGVSSSVLAPGYPSNPHAPILCASLDTLLARGEVPASDFILWDECHHSAADTYRQVLEALPDATVLGVTATPQRGDGRSLGDLFERLVVGANYSELLRAGHLVPCRVFRPERYLGSDLAGDGDPTRAAADAYQRHAGSRQGFAFCRSVTASKELARELTARGIAAANVDGAMASSKRAKILDDFKRGSIRVLTNVFVLTEGFDVPSAEVCLLARGCGNAGTYLQMVGRVLRPSQGKTAAILIDLSGASHEHGLPTADREYALSGRAIRTTGESLRNCPECHVTCRSADRVCPECGHEFPRRVYQGPRLWNLELLEYFESVGDLTSAPKSLMRAEWDRLLEVALGKGFGISFAVGEYEKIFKARPLDAWIKELDDDMRVRELRGLLAFSERKGLKIGWISHRYRDTFGAFPSRSLRERAGIPVPSSEGWPS